MSVKYITSVGKDIIYVCQSCEHREKEFAFSSRNYKYCTKCGGVSVKSTLADSYNYTGSSFVDPPTPGTDTSNYE